MQVFVPKILLNMSCTADISQGMFETKWKTFSVVKK